MEKITPPSSTIIPIVDLSPFTQGGDEASKKKVMKMISEACTNLGVFYIVNHGVPLDKCEKLLEMSNEFFRFPADKKKKSTEKDRKKAGTGYGTMVDKYHDFEYVQMHAPGIKYNGVPTIQPGYKETSEEVFKYLVSTSQLLEGIINDCFNLPRYFLTLYNDDRSWDYMMPMYYATATKTDNLGVHKHEDPQVISIIIQDNVSGLHVLQDEWIPAIPTRVLLTVVVDDLVQVLTNKKFRNVTHKALKNEKSNRLAIDFVYSYGPFNWVEPLLQLTEEIGVKPKYKGFMYKDYIDLIMENFKNPPENEKDLINITYYEI